MSHKKKIDVREQLVREMHALLEDILADECVCNYILIQENIELLRLTLTQYELENTKLLKKQESL